MQQVDERREFAALTPAIEEQHAEFIDLIAQARIVVSAVVVVSSCPDKREFGSVFSVGESFHSHQPGSG